MGKHTPGPWMFKTAPNGDNGIKAEGTWIFAGAFAEIRSDGENDRDEALANARLIAAAPDLLEALAECEDFFDQRADADCDQDGFVPNDEMRMLATVRAAIAKAEARS